MHVIMQEIFHGPLAPRTNDAAYRAWSVNSCCFPFNHSIQILGGTGNGPLVAQRVDARYDRRSIDDRGRRRTMHLGSDRQLPRRRGDRSSFLPDQLHLALPPVRRQLPQQQAR